MDYDIVILGGGSAGIVSGVMAGGLGLRVLLIEKDAMGGERLNTGCTPSKALLHAAKRAHSMRTAGAVGLPSRPVSRDEAHGVLKHVRETIDVVRKADATDQLLRDHGVRLRFGKAHFLDRHTLNLDGETIRADHFILATGSHPVIPDIPGLHEVGYLTNRTLFDLEEIPSSLLIVGGGPIGVEMGQALHRLGCEVTLVQKDPRLLLRDDAEATGMLAQMLREEGIAVWLDAEVRSLHRTEKGCSAQLLHKSEGRECEFAALLIAAGRAPNIEGLNLETIGVAYDRLGVKVDDRLRTTAPNIYACGDVIGDYQFSHMAEYEAKKVVRNIVFPGEVKAVYPTALWTTFTDPELARLGLTEEEARDQGVSYEVLRQPFTQNDRALTDAAANGFIKVLTHGMSGKILGVHILGPNAGELIQEWTLAMEHNLSIRDIADGVHVYPTLSTACQHVAQRWYERKASEPALHKALNVYVNVVRPRQSAIAAGLIGVGLGGLALLAGRAFSRRNKK